MNKQSDLLLAQQVVRRFIGMEHGSPEARRKYLSEHPKADPSKHTVKKKGPAKGKGRDMSDEKGFEALEGLSPAEQRETVQKAVLNMETEEDEKKDKAKGKKKEPARDVSRQEGFEALQGLSPEAQRKLIERALGEK